MLKSLLYYGAILTAIEIPLLFFWILFFHETERLNVVIKSERKQTEQTSLQQHHSEFEGLDFQHLLAKIKGSFSQNLQARISQDRASKKLRVNLSYTPLSFPKNIDVSKTRRGHSAGSFKKYVFVHAQYTDQLSKNTRAFLSLCAQAGISGRKVVRPFVKQTKLSSDDSWFLLKTYYDTKDLNNLLAVAGYASLVDKKEYVNECPSNSSKHVSIHFIDGSKASMDLTRKHFRLKDDLYTAILKNSTRKGWIQCSFLDRKMKISPGKQFCVNGDIIKDWKVLESDIIGNEKCLNIYLWRGNDGVTNRVKFNEERFEFSSIDLTFALKPGRPVMKEAERFRNKSLSAKYIAVYIRSEFMLRGNSMEYLKKCVDLVLEILVALKSATGISRVYVATDMSDFGSSWLIGFRKREQLNENVFKDIHEVIISKSGGVAYTPPSDVTLDRGVVALVDITLISQARYLISAGTGTFQQWVVAKFLENHRNDKQLWSKITVCT